MRIRSDNQVTRLRRQRTGAHSVRWLVAVLHLAVAGPAIVVAEDPGLAMRQRYLDPAGLPSEVEYARVQGILPVPGAESFDWQVVFRLTYRSADVARLQDARAIHTDCYFVRTRKYTARQRVQPVWDGRAYWANDRLAVGAFTENGERVAGYVDEQSGIVRAEHTNDSSSMPDLQDVHYNPFTGQLWRSLPGGEIEEQQSFYLPVALQNERGELVRPACQIVQDKGSTFSLVAGNGDHQSTLATCALSDASDAKRSEGYSPVLAAGCSMITNEPTIVLEMRGEIDADLLDVRGSQLVVRGEMPSPAGPAPAVQIDGRFDEWRSVPGVPDPEGDVVSYLEYNPDTDLLEFKVTNDNEYLYFYSRVAGRHGQTAAGRDRYYWYAYIDADCDPTTGYVPTRDDNCYFGVALGDDCEAQYEFIGGRFVKTFYGSAGRSTEKEILSGRVDLGPSWYSKHDEKGKLRDSYKVEYIRRRGEISITEDFAEGTSEDISIAISPDGSECEMRAAMTGFLRDSNDQPVIAAGQSIDLAVGVEASGQQAGNSKWGADSTVVLHGYTIAK